MKTIKRILLVDDDMDIINPIQLVLESQGYEVFSANDKVKGMELAIDLKPDLAILDVMMNTQYEGFELAREIKSNPLTKGIKVAMHTSITVFTTTNPSIQDMAREVRKDPNNRDLRVVLIKNIDMGNAGIDYFNEERKNIFVSIDEFIPKPMDTKKIISVIEKLQMC